MYESQALEFEVIVLFYLRSKILLLYSLMSLWPITMLPQALTIPLLSHIYRSSLSFFYNFDAIFSHFRVKTSKTFGWVSYSLQKSVLPRMPRTVVQLIHCSSYVWRCQLVENLFGALCTKTVPLEAKIPKTWLDVSSERGKRFKGGLLHTTWPCALCTNIRNWLDKNDGDVSRFLWEGSVDSFPINL